MSIQNYLNQIKNSIFGKDVRQAIYDAIKQCYDDASINNDNANMEVKMARGTHETLNSRITENEKNQEQISLELKNIDIEKATKEEVNIERKRIDNFVSLPEGSTQGNAEILDGRIGENGCNYANLGEAVRNQFNLINLSLFEKVEICNFSMADVKGLATKTCNIIEGRRYRIVATTTSTTQNQFGTLGGNPLNWIDSSEIYKKALDNTTIDFIASKTCSTIGIYNGTVGNFNIVVYELKSVSDEMEILEKSLPNSINASIEENNKKYIYDNEIVITNTSCTGNKFLNYNFIKGNIYCIKIYCDSEEISTFQCGTLVNGGDSSYVDKTEIFNKIPSNYEWYFTATDNANYLLFYSSNKTISYNIEVYKIKSVKDTVEKIQEQIQTNIIKNNTTVIAEFNGIKNDDISCANWVQDINYITQQSDGISCFSKGAVLQKYCTAYNRALIYDFSVKENSIVCAYTQTAKLENLFAQGYCITVDFKNKVLAIRNKYGSSTTDIVDTLPSIYKSINLTLDSYIDEKFRLIVKRNDKRGVIVKLISLKNYSIIATLETDFSSEIVPPYGLGYDYPAFAVIEGTSSLYKLSIVIENSRNCFLYIIGDSLTEGVGTMPMNGWAYKISSIIPNTIVSGRGGATIDGVIRKIDDECKILSPKYVMFMIGTNGGNTTEKLTTLIEKINSIGAIPVACYIPCNKNGTQTTVNKLLESFNIKKIRMDIATSVDYNLSNGYDSSLFVADGVHLNDNGNLRAFNRVLIDCPEIF